MILKYLVPQSVMSLGLVLVDLSLLWFLSQASTSWQGWFVPSQILNSTSSACLNGSGWNASPFFFSSFLPDFLSAVLAFSAPSLTSPPSLASFAYLSSLVASLPSLTSFVSSAAFSSFLPSVFCSPASATFSVLGFSSSAAFFFVSPVSASSLWFS